MATQVFIHLQAAGPEPSPSQAKGSEVGTPAGLRKSRGFVREAEAIHVATAAGLSAARGVLAAVVLQAMLAGGAFLVWRLLH